MGKVSPIKITVFDDDQRLDNWLKRGYPWLTKIQITKMCKRGELRVDSGRVKPSFRLRAGNIVRIPPMLRQNESLLQHQPKIIEKHISEHDVEFIKGLVVFKDQHYIVINKPAGLPSQGGSKLNTWHVDFLSNGLRYNSMLKPKLVHRLDKDTSGILVLARTSKAATEFGKLLKEKKVNKIYWALIAGVPKDLIGSISYGLMPRSTGLGGEKMICILPDEIVFNQGAKTALTNFVIIEKLGQRVSWVGLSPVTGRKHQLRAHLAEIGSPILGDYKYGVKNQTNDGSGWGSQIGGEFSRKLHLHARSITFIHPFTKKNLFIEANLPVHMQNSWDLLGWDLKFAPRDPFSILEN